MSPGKDFNSDEIVKEVVLKALMDADIHYADIKQACVGSVNGRCNQFNFFYFILHLVFIIGDSTAGQQALYTIGLTGIPIFNLRNNCSTGSCTLYLAKQLINNGSSDCILALGFDKCDLKVCQRIF